MGDTSVEAEQGRDEGMPQGPEGGGNESVGTSTQWKHKIKISMKVSHMDIRGPHQYWGATEYKREQLRLCAALKVCC